MARAEARYTITAVDKTKSAFASVNANIKKAGKIAAAGIGGGIAAFGIAARGALSSADEITKLGRQTGLSTRRLSEMRGVLELTSGSLQQYTKGATRLQRSLFDAGRGSKTAVDALAALGLSYEALAPLDPGQQIDAVTAALERQTDPTTRNAAAQVLLGRNFETFVRLASAGTDAISSMREEQRKLGNSFDKVTGSKAERFEDALTRIGQTFRGAVLRTVTANIDEIASAMERIAQAIPPLIELIANLASIVNAIGGAFDRGSTVIREAQQGNLRPAAAEGVGLRRRIQQGALGFLGIGRKPEALMEASLQEQRKTTALLTTAVQSGGFAFGLGE